ncbi:MAG: hypothetical protein JO011_12260 [Ktedonobacteraceae bacterium]|nr:hypothetical protein [Ktedonobacteraceae bacterium]MBV9711668.1 hypothetical protein [Ktedonobacteraceae bacterium]
MKRIYSTCLVLAALVPLLLFFGNGTASAHVQSASRMKVPARCGFYIESQWPWDNNHGRVIITKWYNDCYDATHCEAQDVSFVGDFKVQVSNIIATTYATAFPFTPGSIINTPPVYHNQDEAVCSAYALNYSVQKG